MLIENLGILPLCFLLGIFEKGGTKERGQNLVKKRCPI